MRLVPIFAQGNEGIWSMILIMGSIMFIFWLFMIRPQQKEEDKRMKMYKSLKKNDKVYTVGGIIGVVHTVDLERKEIVLKLDDSNNTKVKFLISAIAAVIQEDKDKDNSKTESKG